MISFKKPVKVDGAKLIDELIADGIEIIGVDQVAHLGKTPPSIDSNGNLLLSIDAKDEAKAAAIVAAHKG